MSDVSDGEAGVRPLLFRRSRGVVVSAGEAGSGKVFLRTPAGAVFAFGEHDYFLWQAMNGQVTSFDVERGFETRFGVALTQADMAAFIAQCLAAGLIEPFVAGAEADPDPLDDTDERAAFPGAAPEKHGPGAAAATMLQGMQEPWVIKLGNPTRLFAALLVVFGPLHYLKWLSPPGAFFAGMIVLKHLSQFQADYAAVKTSVPYWPLMYLFEHVLNIVARVTEGMILQAHGGKIRFFGLRFLLVIVVRGFIDEHAAKSLPRRVRIWSKAGVLLIRLAILDVSILVWIMLRATHPGAARAALFLGVLSFLLFCINACPLVMAEGYEVLAASMNQPALAVRAVKLVMLRLGGSRPPAGMTGAERIGLTFFGLGTLLCTAIIGVGILFDMGTYFTSDLQGLGYLVMLLVVVAAVLYVVLLVRYNRRVSAALRTLGADAMRARPRSEPAGV